MRTVLSTLGLALVAVAGCGRYGFESRTAACDGPDCADAAVGADAPAPGTTVDGGAGTPDAASLDAPLGVCATGHDEDGDGVSDVCDNCPSIANAGQEDVGETNAGQTADGVGDACDPRPAAGGDAIALFDPLLAPLAPTWTIDTGSWTATGDDVAQTDLGSSNRIDSSAFTGDDYAIETRVTLDGLDPSSYNHGVVFRMDTGTGRGWLCGVFGDDTGFGGLMLWTLQSGFANFEEASTDIAVPTTGNAYTILAGGVGADVFCKLGTGEVATTNNSRNSSGTPGLRTNRTQSTFEYVVVYTLGGPL